MLSWGQGSCVLRVLYYLFIVSSVATNFFWLLCLCVLQLIGTLHGPISTCIPRQVIAQTVSQCYSDLNAMRSLHLSVI